MNMAHHPDERVRRGLADQDLVAVAPVADFIPAKLEGARVSERALTLRYKSHIQ
jgi:hypothetical protein